MRLWTQQLKMHFLRYPQTVKILGEGLQVPPQWLRIEAQLVSVLEGAGPSGVELVSTANLLSQAVIFDCMRSTAYSEKSAGGQELPLLPLLPQLDAEKDRHSIEQLIEHTPAGGFSLLDFVLEQLLQRATMILQKMNVGGS